jgi:hypothetical protein
MPQTPRAQPRYTWAMRSGSWVVVALVALFAPACASPGVDLDSGPLVQVADAHSGTGAYDVAVLAHSPTPVRGNHTVQLVVTAAGTPADDLALTIVPWMPAMGHGTSVRPTVTPLGGGAYQLDDVDLFMPGLWELRTTIASPEDYVAPSFEVQ